jgi:pimeloyl-ACP methyl ester carboxylesterase
MLRLGHDRPVFAVDLPGNGYSEALRGGASLDDFASAIGLTLDQLGVGDAELAGDGTGGAVALAMSRANPNRYPKTTVANVPIAGSPLPPSFTVETHGEHLIRAWHAVRDDVIHGPWCSRQQNQIHRFGSELDVEGIHRRVVGTLMSENHLALCSAAVAAPLDRMMANATVLPGTAPLASRMTA